MNLEEWLLVAVASYVTLLLTIRAFTRRRAAAKENERRLSSMGAEFRSRIGSPAANSRE